MWCNSITVLMQLILFGSFTSLHAITRKFDFVVIGGSGGGVMAAIAAARQGASVGLFEQTNHLGGMTSSGLGFTDYGNKNVIGGLALEFYKRVGAKYDTAIRWTFEPHIAESVFVNMAAEANVQIFYNQRIREMDGVIKTGNRISSLVMDKGDTIFGKEFCDASYDGDILPQAGISFTWGREGLAQYGETLAGVRPRSLQHQFPDSISAYETGTNLFPEIFNIPRDTIGASDKKIQAYNFRLCMSNRAENRVAFTRPQNYDSTQFKLVARYINYLINQGNSPTVSAVAKLSNVFGQKTDVNNMGPFSSDYIGHNWDYPNATYARKAEIWKEHEQYLRGFWYFCGHDPSLPLSFRNSVLNWGLAKDEFADNDNWPYWLYIREARRMVGEYVMIQKDIQTTRTKPDAIGMGSYQSDSHHIQRIVNSNGFVENEGEMFVGVSPYEIPYRIILPKRQEATNLLVAICFSASHVTYSTLRMEPQYMIIGQAAGIAAKIAIDSNVDVQEINITKLRDVLAKQGAVLKYPTSVTLDGERTENRSHFSLNYRDATLTVDWQPYSASKDRDLLTLYSIQGRLLGRWPIHAGRNVIPIFLTDKGVSFARVGMHLSAMVSQ